MDILKNKEEMKRLHESYLAKVKDAYKCDLTKFSDWIYQEGNEAEGYIEIPSNETISGHAEILDW